MRWQGYKIYAVINVNRCCFFKSDFQESINMQITFLGVRAVLFIVLAFSTVGSVCEAQAISTAFRTDYSEPLVVRRESWSTMRAGWVVGEYRYHLSWTERPGQSPVTQYTVEAWQEVRGRRISGTTTVRLPGDRRQWSTRWFPVRQNATPHNWVFRVTLRRANGRVYTYPVRTSFEWGR